MDFCAHDVWKHLERWRYLKSRIRLLGLLQQRQLHRHLRGVSTGATLVLTHGVGHVANQSEVFLEADLPIVVCVQPLLHLLDGRGAVCVLRSTKADMEVCC